jgi:hypothetical protein
MSKVLSILRDLGESVVMLLRIIVALVILVLLAVPLCIVILIGETVTLIKRKYEERKRSNSADMCDEESAKDSASDSDDARDTAGTESAGSDDEF